MIPRAVRRRAEIRSSDAATARDDCFATASTGTRPDPERCADIARRLAAACRRSIRSSRRAIASTPSTSPPRSSTGTEIAWFRSRRLIA